MKRAIADRLDAGEAEQRRMAAILDRAAAASRETDIADDPPTKD
jgi:hypothetical protein